MLNIFTSMLNKSSIRLLSLKLLLVYCGSICLAKLHSSKEYINIIVFV